MSRARPRRSVEQCPQCSTWWKTWVWEQHGEWLMYCRICGVVQWKAIVRLTDLARLTAAQQAAYWRSVDIESTD